jgi:hypothetical protein
MHEALVTRGDVQGLSFDAQVEIYCPQNVALLHTKCHHFAQWYERGKRIVARDIIRWCGEEAVHQFLFTMHHTYHSSAALEAGRRLVEWKLLSSEFFT